MKERPNYDRYQGPFLAECLRDGGYQTAYIGKWHIDGRGRSAFVPPERRLGFDWWKGFECNHDYQDSHYHVGDDAQPRKWRGYDADAELVAQLDDLLAKRLETVGDDFASKQDIMQREGYACHPNGQPKIIP